MWPPPQRRWHRQRVGSPPGRQGSRGHLPCQARPPRSGCRLSTRAPANPRPTISRYRCRSDLKKPLTRLQTDYRGPLDECCGQVLNRGPLPRRLGCQKELAMRRPSRRAAIALVIAVTAFTAVVAFAASLNVTSTGLQAGAAVVGQACTGPIATSYTTA